ncbi:hypothetical protein [Endozoicomonas sp. ALB032]|uniref:hypothetical protein n=1 Tax=Endozoicomonas sp. ALB032 TaxID=3403082 RepID=UPI003BB5E200
MEKAAVQNMRNQSWNAEGWKKPPSRICETNWLGTYIWLKNQDTKDAEFRRAAIENSDDPVYGLGYKKARASLKLMPLKTLLQFIKERKEFPSRWAAFFYH